MIDERFTAPFWDDRYRSADRLWSGEPNAALVAEASDLAPGTALDVGSGEGGDAIWLARRGWRVTATDVSAVALERGAGHAGPELADRIEWRQADLVSWVPDASWDLVTVHFMHLPRALREPAFARLAAAVAPGGALLVVGHDVSHLDGAATPHGDPDMFFTADEVAATLDPAAWTVVTRDRRAREAAMEGETITVHDAILRARRSG